MIHRDISFGNIILNKEIYCDQELQLIDVEQDDAQQVQVALIRRRNVDIQTIGGLHDLDMVAYISGPMSKKERGLQNPTLLHLSVQQP